jgi:hypothetical protein
VAAPLSEEYMHIGAHQIRLGNLQDRICSGRKRVGVVSGDSRDAPTGVD